jgi:uncharacterized protein YbjT (DUF2867 family)
MFAILGATGNAGRATIRQLRKRGFKVRAVVRDESKAQDLEALGCKIAVADLHDAAALAKAIEGAETVQAICPISPRAPDPAGNMRAIVGTICKALVATRPAKVLAISDYGAELGAGTGITLPFHFLEAELRKTGVALTLLRSAEHMQNWSRLLRTAAETGVLPSLHHPLTKLFPMVSARDVGIAAADLLVSSGPQASPRLVHVEGPRRYSALDVAETLGLALGRTIVARELPRSDWIAALIRGGLGASYAALVAELYDAHNAGLIDVERGATDICRGATEFGDPSIFPPALVAAAAPPSSKSG